MADPIILTVPEAVSAAYLVPLPGPIDDPRAVVRAHLDRHQPPLAGLVGAFLDRPLLVIEVEPSADTKTLPVHLLRVFGADPADLDRLATAPYTAFVAVTFGPGRLPVHELVARTVAVALAAPTAAPVVDLQVPNLVPCTVLEESLPPTSDPVALVDFVLVPQSAGEQGNWLTTKGLQRFGLPELQVEGVPPQVAGAWTGILSGIAQGLVRWFGAEVEPDGDGDGPERAFVELDRRFEVTSHDVAEAYGRPIDEDEPMVSAVVQFAFNPSPEPGYDEFLDVRAPDDFARSASEFHVDVVERLYGRPQGEIRYTEPSDDLDAAMDVAASCLPVARARFLAGEFEHRTLLMVKWRLPVDGGDEFPWAFITGWRRPDVLTGTSANDAAGDPGVRVGRPVTIPADAVADWGVWIDGEGLVEGGWTNAVLEGRPQPPIPTAPTT